MVGDHIHRLLDKAGLLHGSGILMPLSKTKFGNFAIEKLPKLRQCDWFIREQIALGAGVLLRLELSFKDVSVDSGVRDVEFFCDLNESQVAGPEWTVIKAIARHTLG